MTRSVATDDFSTSPGFLDEEGLRPGIISIYIAAESNFITCRPDVTRSNGPNDDSDICRFAAVYRMKGELVPRI